MAFHLPFHPAASQPTRADRWRPLATVALGLAAMATYLAIVAANLWSSHEREIEFARRGQESLAKVLEQHALATVDKIDTVLTASRLHLGPALAGEAGEPDRVNADLARYLALIGESQSLRIANSEGRFVFDASGRIFPATIADRAYFKRNRDDARGRLVISEPIHARITHNWVITLSRRIQDGHGGFLGLVQAAVQADFFQHFYASLNLGPAQSVALYDDQLRLIARYPAAPDSLGKQAASEALKALVAAQRTEGVHTARSGVDGVERLYVMRRIGQHPLYVVVGRATHDVLANWYRQVWAGVASALVLAAVLAGWIIVWLHTYAHAKNLARGMTQAYGATVRQTRALLDSLPDPAWLSDRDGRMIAVNDAYVRACGRPPEQIIGQMVETIWPAETSRTLRVQDTAVLVHQSQQRREGVQPVADGSSRSFEYISTPVLDEKGVLVGVAGVARDITQLRAEQERIRHMADHDELTDLPNRSLLQERMAHALAREAGDDTQIAIMFLDLDHFKNINDSLGHEMGDRLLQQVAQRLRNNLDAGDTVSRQGGDEFAILLQHCSGLARVAAIAQRLIDAIAQPFQVDERELLVSASIGISVYPQDGTDIGTLLRNADTAMYQAKAAERGSYQFFAPEMNARVFERMALETNLRRALQNREFRLHYQPQVDAVSGRILGVEALIRWRHPELGEILPGRFIPIAEETSLIGPIGEWVLQEACRQCRAWMDQGLPPVVVAVNLSAAQFRQRRLAQGVAAALASAGISPQWLELEITESVLMQDTQRVLETLDALKALGVRLSMDDFGTGYSSLSYLKRLPIDKIKIDQSFVRELPDNDEDAAIVRAIIGIASHLRKGVIAEGVETVAQREFLLRHGCSEMQGYHFSHPLPAGELAALIRQWTAKETGGEADTGALARGSTPVGPLPACDAQSPAGS
ncbi:MAG: EAL domain-containing protein [Pseudomonadota bacterium]